MTEQAPLFFGPYDDTSDPLTREPLLGRNDPPSSLLARVLLSCSTRWFKTSWLGIFVYTAVCCLNYLIGYYAIFRPMGWEVAKLSNVRVFGDLVTVGWFALGFVSLPWHQWEQLTCIKTKDCRGVGRFMAWWLGTIVTFFVYGYMGENPLFQTSLASNLSPGQRAVYAVTFAVIAVIVAYWMAKMCPTRRCKPICEPETARKVIFIRLFILLTLLFVVSAALCSADATCKYHLHHWWFGFVLIMLSTAALDNWFDYFLQGIFWTFLTESIFNYGLTFGEFFI